MRPGLGRNQSHAITPTRSNTILTLLRRLSFEPINHTWGSEIIRNNLRLKTLNTYFLHSHVINPIPTMNLRREDLPEEFREGYEQQRRSTWPGLQDIERWNYTCNSQYTLSTNPRIDRLHHMTANTPKKRRQILGRAKSNNLSRSKQQ